MKDKIKKAMADQKVSAYKLSKECQIPYSTLTCYLEKEHTDTSSRNVEMMKKYLRI
jgi:hypothetical protein